MTADPALGKYIGGNVSGGVYAPQNLALYSYALQNPVALSDIDGQACSRALFNYNSGFCVRAREYAELNHIKDLQDKTTFFGGASVVSEALANVDAVGSSVKASSETREFLEKTGTELKKFNLERKDQILKGVLGVETKEKNDKAFVEFEQTNVQNMLDKLKKDNKEKYNKIVKEIDANFNDVVSGGAWYDPVPKFARRFDPGFTKVLDEVRGKLGRDIRFEEKNDRIAIGETLLMRIRSGEIKP